MIMTRTSVFRDCQMHYSLYLFEEKRDPYDFRPSFCWTPCPNLYMINCYWTTFETLAQIERDCKERQLCMGDCLLYIERLQLNPTVH